MSDFFAKAQASQADTLIFDLEDAVAPDRKAHARETLKEVLQDSEFSRFERTVRVNDLDTPYFLDDVLCMVEAGADGLVVPKQTQLRAFGLWTNWCLWQSSERDGSLAQSSCCR